MVMLGEFVEKLTIPSEANKLKLIYDICEAHELQMEGDEEAVPEVIRVLRAVASGGSCILAEESRVTKVLLRGFASNPLLWRYVTIEALPSTS